MELEHSQIEEDIDDQQARRRIALADLYKTLPEYGSDSFWRIIEEPGLDL